MKKPETEFDSGNEAIGLGMENPSILKRLHEQFSTRVGQIEQRNKTSKLNLILVLCSTLESCNYEWNDELTIEPTRSLQISHRCRHTVKSEFALAWNRHFFISSPACNSSTLAPARACLREDFEVPLPLKDSSECGFRVSRHKPERNICDWRETINYWAIIEIRLSGRRNALEPSHSGDDLQEDFQIKTFSHSLHAF